MGARILVVDDYPAIADVTAAMATMEGYDVRVAHSGEEALRTVDTFQPDLIVLDLMLGGGLSGEDVLAAVTERCPGTRVLILSALVSAAGSPVAPRAGEIEVMAKPFKVRELSRRIARLLSEARSSAA